jgi:hypothetical protein
MNVTGIRSSVTAAGVALTLGGAAFAAEGQRATVVAPEAREVVASKVSDKAVASQSASTKEAKTAFFGCFPSCPPCYTAPVCRPAFPTYPGYPGWGGYGGGYGVGYGTGYGTPGYGAPGYGVPAYGAPGYGVPGYGAPGYGVPGYGVPYGLGVSNTLTAPAIGVPYGAPGYGTPLLGAPAVAPVVNPYGLPGVNPYAVPAINPGFPGVAPISPFYGKTDATKVNAKVPSADRRTTSPYFK